MVHQHPRFRTPNMHVPFRDLPTEIILIIGRHCDTRSLSRLSRCNTRLHAVLFSELWLTGTIADNPSGHFRPGKPPLYYAIEKRNVWLAHRCLKNYENLGAENVQGILDGTAVLFETFRWLPPGIPASVLHQPASAMPLSPIMRAVRAGWDAESLRILHYGGCSVDVRRRINLPRYGALGGELHSYCVPEICQEVPTPAPGLAVPANAPPGGPTCRSALHDAIEMQLLEVLDFLLGECWAESGFKGGHHEEWNPWNSMLPLGEWLCRRAVTGPVARFPVDLELDPNQEMIVNILEHHGHNVSRWIRRSW
ncbi:hypothetical protein VTJ83DRAFT_2865 [Remersonia thermophila]|uniref:F-box domain-containing protein n=1 Tax=Remersonia thermophila TaxID=72144 RepID=A0ABR4DEL6_9PEZI